MFISAAILTDTSAHCTRSHFTPFCICQMVYALIFFLFTSKNSYFKVYFKEQLFLQGSTYIKIVCHFYVQECVSVAIFFSHDRLIQSWWSRKLVDWIKGPIDTLMRFNTSHCGQRQIVKNDREPTKRVGRKFWAKRKVTFRWIPVSFDWLPQHGQPW